MARLYIRHEPTDAEVTIGNFRESSGEYPDGWHSFRVLAVEVSEYGVEYLCVVHEGKCWAAREKTFFSNGRMCSLTCVPFNDDPSGKLMLLKDTLLN